MGPIFLSFGFGVFFFFWVCKNRETEVNQAYFLEELHLLLSGHEGGGLGQSSPQWVEFGLCRCISYDHCVTGFKVPWCFLLSMRPGVSEGFLQMSCPATSRCPVCLCLRAGYLSAFLSLPSGRLLLWTHAGSPVLEGFSRSPAPPSDSGKPCTAVPQSRSLSILLLFS